MPLTLISGSPFTVAGTGQHGEYVIERHGYHPETGLEFRYKDQNYIFYFYILDRLEPPHYTISVRYISSEPLGLAPPIIPRADTEYLKQNIKRYFENVSVLSYGKLLPPDPVPEITFDWGNYGDSLPIALIS